MSLTIDLSSQVVLVTGGTRGIGQSTVEQFLIAGAKVAFCAPEADECARAEEDFQKRAGDRVMGMAANLRDAASLDRLTQAVIARWGRIDTLICNAAEYGSVTTPENVEVDGFVELLQANVVGNFHLCRLVLPQMKARGAGSIVLIASIVAFTTMPTNIPYASSKAALMSVARSLAADTAATGVRVNCIAPGLIRTQFSRDVWQDEAVARAYIAEKVPMQRMAEPSEIASVCVFLASPMASYITAATISVDGGRAGIGQPAGTAAPSQK